MPNANNTVKFALPQCSDIEQIVISSYDVLVHSQTQISNIKPHLKQQFLPKHILYMFLLPQWSTKAPSLEQMAVIGMHKTSAVVILLICFLHGCSVFECQKSTVLQMRGDLRHHDVFIINTSH